ncbi:MAG TPA: hypothetical protein VEY91_08280, partial [Candidatus Limnocylindria bacterium]|nr:hypothetical protein [Candidatus Limnocylindria bacterium]
MADFAPQRRGGAAMMVAGLSIVGLVLGASVCGAHPHGLPAPPPPDSTRFTSAKRGNPLTWFLSDAWYVVSSPARLNLNGALWAAGVLGATGALYAYDQEIFDASQDAKGNAVYDAIIDVGETIEPLGHMGRTNKFYVVGLAIGSGFKIRPLETACAEILESHLVSGG